MVAAMTGAGKHIPSACLALLALCACEGELSVPEPPPVADAGFDQLRYLVSDPLTIALDGRASCDPMGGGISDVTWTLVSAPGATPELSPSSLLRARFDAELPGEYLLSLVVTSGGRTSEPDYISVRVERGEGEDIVVAPPATTACGDALPEDL